MKISDHSQQRSWSSTFEMHHFGFSTIREQRICDATTPAGLLICQSSSVSGDQTIIGGGIRGVGFYRRVDIDKCRCRRRHVLDSRGLASLYLAASDRQIRLHKPSISCITSDLDIIGRSLRLQSATSTSTYLKMVR